MSPEDRFCLTCLEITVFYPADSACRLYLQHYNIVKGAQLVAAVGDSTRDEYLVSVQVEYGAWNACQLGKG